MSFSPVSFLVGWVPLLKQTTEEKGTLILTSLLEDLDIASCAEPFRATLYGFGMYPLRNPADGVRNLPNGVAHLPT